MIPGVQQQQLGDAQQQLTFPTSQAQPTVTPVLAGLVAPAQITQPSTSDAAPAAVCAVGDARTQLFASLEEARAPPATQQPALVPPAAVPAVVAPAVAPSAAAPLPRASGQVTWNGPPQDTRGLTWAAITPAATPTIATISDRRVTIPPTVAPDQPSLYRLCRQWVQNEPELTLMAEANVPSQLPPLAALTPEEEAVLAEPALVEQPLLGTAAEPATQQLVEHHMQHWKAVRQQARRKEEVASQRYAARLQGLFPGMVVAAAAAQPEGAPAAQPAH